ncbi:hypothetical protein E6C67_03145 (plasmid) [Azospirillum sp. TSA2s]|jgi:hypothetical protein|uniref:hypothetical protein n=1 Tax=Azospirillum sp. TSA2s TaxID=709810 RepID=UPI0010AAC898|nr:hypothetical protein [Azospirillum sp. TSA2s]QCG92955.1 hypothetical protein E6C67_03145 [Azospirillum sp. TSA2s]
MTTHPPRWPRPAGADETCRLSALVDSLIAGSRTRDAPSAAVAAAVRYVLAIQATDTHGDTCRFPRCACPVMDCSRHPSETPPSR